MAISLSVELFEYRIKSGDSLSLLIAKFYNVGFHNPEYSRRLNQILTLNPHVKNPNLIYTGTSLRLASPTIPSDANTTFNLYNQMCLPDIDYLLSKLPKEDEANFWLLSWLATNSNFLTVPGAAVFAAQENLLGPGNVKLIRDIDALYFDYKAGKLTKGQYDYQRKLKLDQLKRNIGSLDKLLFGGKTPHEAIRIARGGGIPATQNIMNNADKLTKLASYGKYGGYVLGAVGAGAACVQIANTDSTQEKNEIFVETLASTTVGTIVGVPIYLFLVSTPVGWTTAVGASLLVVGTSYFAGVAAKHAYTVTGSKVDLVTGSGVGSICQ